jgi:hypothetical protein
MHLFNISAFISVRAGEAAAEMQPATQQLHGLLSM